MAKTCASSECGRKQDPSPIGYDLSDGAWVCDSNCAYDYDAETGRKLGIADGWDKLGSAA